MKQTSHSEDEGNHTIIVTSSSIIRQPCVCACVCACGCARTCVRVCGREGGHPLLIGFSTKGTQGEGTYGVMEPRCVALLTVGIHIPRTWRRISHRKTMLADRATVRYSPVHPRLVKPARHSSNAKHVSVWVLCEHLWDPCRIVQAVWCCEELERSRSMHPRPLKR